MEPPQWYQTGFGATQASSEDELCPLPARQPWANTLFSEPQRLLYKAGLNTPSIKIPWDAEYPALCIRPAHSGCWESPSSLCGLKCDARCSTHSRCHSSLDPKTPAMVTCVSLNSSPAPVLSDAVVSLGLISVRSPRALHPPAGRSSLVLVLSTQMQSYLVSISHLSRQQLSSSLMQSAYSRGLPSWPLRKFLVGGKM